MSEKIRKPRKPKPTNPARAPAPEVPAPEVPAPVPAPKAALGSYGVPSIDKHDALFVAASRAVEAKKGVVVPPRFLKAVMGLESGEDGDYPVDRCRPSDGHPGPRSCGPMQIKWPFHEHRCPECSQRTVAGHVEMAAHILADAMTAHRCDEYEAYVRGYLTSDDVNGTSQREAVAGLRRRVKAMEADAAGATPAPEPPTTPAPKPATVKDALLAVTGGRDARVHFPFGAMNTEPFYEYGIGRIRPLSVAKNSAYQHPGDDIDLPLGAPIFAPVAGTVVCAGTGVGQGAFSPPQSCAAFAADGGVGRVEVQVNATESLIFGHCHKALVKVGQRVEAGQQLATVGSFVGPHLHLEYRRWNPAKRDYTMHAPLPEIARLMGGATAGSTPEAPGPTLNVEIAIADGAGLNRPKTKLLPGDLWVTVHETANEKPGADARMHRDFVNTGGGAESVSFHFAVDDQRAVQILPLDEIAYHAGDRCDDPKTDHGCFRSVAIETCVNAPKGSARWAKAKRNLAALVAGIVATPEKFVGGAALTGRFSLDRVAPHQAWSGKNCPTRMLAEGSLPAVVAEARSIAAGTQAGTAPAPAKRFPVNLPDDVVTVLFPDADPTGKGVVTAKWIEKGCPAFLRTVEAEGWRFWIFSNLILRSKDGAVEEVEVRP